MIEVKSYLMGPDGEFRDVHQVARYDGDRDYVEGALELTVNHVPIIDQGMYDYVDQLWAYLVRVVESVQKTGRGETLFPDQPLRFSLEQQGPTGMLVTSSPSSGRRTAYAPATELTTALKVAAADFFRRMSALIPENASRYEHELRLIETLK